MDKLFKRIQEIGFKTLLLSNNNETRIKKFITNIDTPYIANAQKPTKNGYFKAMELLNVKKEETIFVGDQIFTDILGANRCGIPNILVKFIRLPNETKIGKRRKLENIILSLYSNNKSYQHRMGNVKKEE